MKIINYLWNRWYPITGWALALGFFINCVIAPYLDITIVNWYFLVATLTLLTGLKNWQDCKVEDCPLNKEYPRDWIILIGYCLFIGYFNNAVVGQFYANNTINWIEMLSALAVLIGIGTDRERKLHKIGSEYKKKQLWIKLTILAVTASVVCICFVSPVLDSVVNKRGWLPINWTPVTVEWYYIVAAIGIVGGDAGYRNIFIKKAQAKADGVMSKVQEGIDKVSDEIPSKKEKE